MEGRALRGDDRRMPRVAAAALLSLALLLSSAGAQADSLARGADRLIDVIVRATSASQAKAATEGVGGRVELELPIIDGVSAKVPQNEIQRLRSTPYILEVTPDAKVGFHGDASQVATGQSVTSTTRSDALWKAGITGRGVTVAILDTGIYAGHPDLQGPNGSRVIHCEDFSAEVGTEAECADTFGHGTFMAGLIAGNGASSNGLYKGAAPEADLVAVKVAGFDGSTDVSHVLAGLQWVVSHRSEFGIDVLNLSLGTDSAQSYKLSPLDYAVERAWFSGITVVVSAGNSGPNAKTIMKPADDPYVITVGSSNDEGTATISDDDVPVFSSRGPTKADGLAKPDVVSPGVHTISLRSPGSAIDQYFGATAAVGNAYFRGTGTSMSTATVSGVAAQILQKSPSLSPNQVKARLMNTSRKIAETNAYAAGKGLIDAYAATMSTSTASANQSGLLGNVLQKSTGLGLLQNDRGSLDIDVATPAGQITLLGEFKAQYTPSLISALNPLGLLPWDALTYTTLGWDATTWKATTWKSDLWAATTWKATTWKATTWKGTEWANSDWTATTWKDVDWDATTWKATTWKSAWYAAAWD